MGLFRRGNHGIDTGIRATHEEEAYRPPAGAPRQTDPSDGWGDGNDDPASLS